MKIAAQRSAQPSSIVDHDLGSPQLADEVDYHLALNETLEVSSDCFPSATPYQIFHSVIDVLTDSLEERVLPDRRICNSTSTERVDRRLTSRRATDK